MSDPVTAAVVIGALTAGTTIYTTEEQKKAGARARDDAKKEQDKQLALLETEKKETNLKTEAVSKRNQMLRAQNEISSNTNQTVLSQAVNQAAATAPVKTLLGQ